MPDVIVKLYAGRSEREKQSLAEAIVAAVKAALNGDDNTASVGIGDLEPEAWADKVYRPAVLEQRDKLYQAPGYKPRG
jgi:4-oxalocrotonate tautomerase